MLWPHRTDNWQYGAKPAQQVFASVARAIARFEPVTIGVKPVDYAAAHCIFEDDELIDIVEMESDDAGFVTAVLPLSSMIRVRCARSISASMPGADSTMDCTSRGTKMSSSA